MTKFYLRDLFWLILVISAALGGYNWNKERNYRIGYIDGYFGPNHSNNPLYDLYLYDDLFKKLKEERENMYLESANITRRKALGEKNTKKWTSN